MKSCCVGLWFLLSLITTNAQSPEKKSMIDSLQEKLAQSRPDTNRVNILSDLSLQYLQLDVNRSLDYAQQGFVLASKLKFIAGQANCLRRSGIAYYLQGRYPEALDRFQKGLSSSESVGHFYGIAAGLGHIGNIYTELGDFVKARDYLHRSLNIILKGGAKNDLALAYKRLAETYLGENLIDSASKFLKLSYVSLNGVKNTPWLGGVLKDFGDLQLKKGNVDSALSFYRNGIDYAAYDNNSNILSDLYLGVAKSFLQKGQLDSSISYVENALSFSKKNKYAKGELSASKFLAAVFENVNMREALKYYKIASSLYDSLFNNVKINQVQNLLYLDLERKKDKEIAETKYHNQLRLYALFTALFILLLIAILLYRNNRVKQKAKGKIEIAYNELKSTQAQLIHSEKMASLGELSAGIAHEIQNPLNFVNNFSEVNNELIDEMTEKLSAGNANDAASIANEIKENNSKITQHGKRADAIVKGMLQHSRKSTGKKEPTDINALCDEFLKLSYRANRTKDQSLNVDIQTNFATDIGKVNIVPQDIGRVLLNLFSNAFYAVAEKRKVQPKEYEPAISVTTKKTNDKVEITVKDNGSGIPKKIVNKIFQPFFTTKPTGEGTGLGLSLSYDIIKAHGGEIKVESKEGEYAIFIVELPFEKL